MKLYHRPDCPFCWKVRLFLQETGIEVQEFSVTLGKKHPAVVNKHLKLHHLFSNKANMISAII